MPSESPQLREINISFSAGGKVSIVKYDVSSDYHISASKRYEIPDGMSEEDVAAFEEQKYNELRQLIDDRANAEFEERYNQSFMA